MVCSKDIFTHSPYMHADRVEGSRWNCRKKVPKKLLMRVFFKKISTLKKSLKVPPVWFKSPINFRDFNKNPSNQGLKRKRTEPYVHSQPHKIQTTPHDSLRNLTLSPWSARDIYAMPCQLLLCQQVRSC